MRFVIIIPKDFWQGLYAMLPTQDNRLVTERANGSGHY